MVLNQLQRSESTFLFIATQVVVDNAVPCNIQHYRNHHRQQQQQRHFKTRHAWQSLACSPLGAAVSPPSEYWRNILTYWSSSCLAALPLIERTWSSQKNFRRWLYNSLSLKLRGHWTESHQISIKCTEMIVSYSADIKNCDPAISFGTLRWRMKIIVKLRANRGKNCRF